MRSSKYPIQELILQRRSMRAMSGERISEQQLMSLFEAARWAPSCYNNQPWRFLYAKRDTETWPLFFDLLVPFNQGWVKNAAVLILVISKKTFERNGKPSVSHSFDTGAACENLSLQGIADGLVVHAMEGFDYDLAKKQLEVPDDYKVEAMIAVGKTAPAESLDPELQEGKRAELS